MSLSTPTEADFVSWAVGSVIGLFIGESLQAIN
jgi:predicted branched-subunit amino acid permease